MSFQTHSFLCSAMGLVICAAPSFAQNLITNPSFEDALNHWDTAGSSWSIVVDESDPCARVDFYQESASIWQCVQAIEDRLFLYGTLNAWSRVVGEP